MFWSSCKPRSTSSCWRRKGNALRNAKCTNHDTPTTKWMWGMNQLFSITRWLYSRWRCELIIILFLFSEFGWMLQILLETQNFQSVPFMLFKRCLLKVNGLIGYMTWIVVQGSLLLSDTLTCLLYTVILFGFG